MDLPYMHPDEVAQWLYEIEARGHGLTPLLPNHFQKDPRLLKAIEVFFQKKIDLNVFDSVSTRGVVVSYDVWENTFVYRSLRRPKETLHAIFNAAETYYRSIGFAVVFYRPSCMNY